MKVFRLRGFWDHSLLELIFFFESEFHLWKTIDLLDLFIELYQLGIIIQVALQCYL